MTDDRLTRIGLVAAALLALPAGIEAQEYVPSGHLGPGTEMVVVLISSSTCVANGDADFLAAVPRMMWSVGREAERNGMTPVIVGVAMDASVDAGVRYLSGFGSFDEISVGRDWGNSAVIEHVWRHDDGSPMIPQVLVMTRTVAGSNGRIDFGEPQVAARLIGPDAIKAWVARDTPLAAPRDVQ